MIRRTHYRKGKKRECTYNKNTDTSRIPIDWHRKHVMWSFSYFFFQTWRKRFREIRFWVNVNWGTSWFTILNWFWPYKVGRKVVCVLQFTVFSAAFLKVKKLDLLLKENYFLTIKQLLITFHLWGSALVATASTTAETTASNGHHNDEYDANNNADTITGYVYPEL